MRPATGLLIGLLIAAFVAYCNATSSAELAALYPESGGTYVYGRKRLGHLWGFLAGWGFVVGKLASCAAMALTFATTPRRRTRARLRCWRRRTDRGQLFRRREDRVATRTLVVVVLACLALVGVCRACSAAAPSRRARCRTSRGERARNTEAAGLLFFAFAGYARIATLGEESRRPARTIPRAIPLALGITLRRLCACGNQRACRPLGADAGAIVGAALWPRSKVVAGPRWSSAVRVGAAVGVARRAAVAAGRRQPNDVRDGVERRPSGFPRLRASAPSRFRIVPSSWSGCIVARSWHVADVRDAIGFSSFAVLIYYAIANAAALTLDARERRWPRGLAMCGIGGCVLLAFSLPVATIAAGTGLLAAGAITFRMSRTRGR